MNEKEKSLKLAKLMGWPITAKNTQLYTPYSNHAVGLAQFAAILLHDEAETKHIIIGMITDDIEFTQGNFLDMKLKFYRVDIDE